MPPGASPLSKQQIELIRAWIDQGRFSALKTGNSQLVVTTSRPLPNTSRSSIFAARIRPVFAARCYQCHGPTVQQNGLRLDSLAATLKGSTSRKVILPGNSERSALIRRLSGLELPRMPYGSAPLSAETVNAIRHWIDAGAPGPDSKTALPLSNPVKHWAFVKPVRPKEPHVKNAAWPRNPIDKFVLARLERGGV